MDIMKDEVDETEEQVTKRRKIGDDRFTSSFMVQKRAKVKAQIVAPLKTIPTVKVESSIFTVPAEEPDESLRSHCQRAFDHHFRQCDGDSLILRVAFKARRQGMNWVYGDIANFNLRDPVIAEALRGTAKRVRLLLPPENFTAFPSRFPNIRSSSSSSYPVNSLLTVEFPIVLSVSLGHPDLDLNYLTITGRHIRRNEE